MKGIALSTTVILALALPLAAQGQGADGAAAGTDAAAGADTVDAYTATAASLDTSKSLRCSLADASECDLAAQCSDVDMVEIDLPEFWRVDFAGKQIASLDGLRASPIASIETLESAIVLQGHQEGRGWTLVIERATGHLQVAAASTEGAFVLAGGCIAE